MSFRDDTAAGLIVRSVSGHDRDGLFVIIAAEPANAARSQVYIADGRLRKLEKPKLKNLKHLKVEGSLDGEAVEALTGGQLSNRRLRELLKEFRQRDGSGNEN